MTGPAVWVIREPALVELLRRAHQGEDPDLLLVEFLANSTVDRDHPESPS